MSKTFPQSGQTGREGDETDINQIGIQGAAAGIMAASRKKKEQVQNVSLYV